MSTDAPHVLSDALGMSARTVASTRGGAVDRHAVVPASGAVARIRNALATATHTFFQQEGFLYVHTPIVTCSDCEGAGEMFQVPWRVLGRCLQL